MLIDKFFLCKNSFATVVCHHRFVTIICPGLAEAANKTPQMESMNKSLNISIK